MKQFGFTESKSIIPRGILLQYQLRMEDKKMKRIYIIGAGGFGKEVAWIIECINRETPEWIIEGFLDDNEMLHGKVLNGYKVLGKCDLLCSVNEDIWVVCTIGAPRIRKQIINKIMTKSNIHFATIIAPTAIIPNTVMIGEGTIIGSGTISSVNVTIGSHVIINMNCTIGHDTVISDYVTLRPSVDIAGNVLLEECVDAGIGAMVLQNKIIKHDAVLGAGTVVIRDVQPFQTMVGIPANQIVKNENII